jgi:hypothetical protein
MIAALQLGPEYYIDFRDQYTRRRNTLLGILRQHGFTCQAPEGTYFITANYSLLRDIPDMEFAAWLTEKVGVACLPISSFYLDALTAKNNLRLVRFAFCKEIGTLEEAGRARELTFRLGLGLGFGLDGFSRAAKISHQGLTAQDHLQNEGDDTDVDGYICYVEHCKIMAPTHNVPAYGKKIDHITLDDPIDEIANSSSQDHHQPESGQMKIDRQSAEVKTDINHTNQSDDIEERHPYMIRQVR